jgi:hypothetical protein
VEVYGLPAAHDQGMDKVVPNVWWLPWGMFDPDRPAHVHITWRNLWSHMYGAKTPARYVWLHDSLKDVVVTPYLTERTDAYFVLSKKVRPGSTSLLYRPHMRARTEPRRSA